MSFRAGIEFLSISVSYVGPPATLQEPGSAFSQCCRWCTSLRAWGSSDILSLSASAFLISSVIGNGFIFRTKCGNVVRTKLLCLKGCDDYEPPAIEPRTNRISSIHRRLRKRESGRHVPQNCYKVHEAGHHLGK